MDVKQAVTRRSEPVNHQGPHQGCNSQLVDAVSQSTTKDHTRAVEEGVKQHHSTTVQEQQAKLLTLVLPYFDISLK